MSNEKGRVAMMNRMEIMMPMMMMMVVMLTMKTITCLNNFDRHEQ